jgi:O-antigen/teichoic acid export membrane protein
MTAPGINSDTPHGIAETSPLEERAARQKMSELNENHKIVFNAGTNAGVMLAKVAVVFIASPILVHGLEDARYGVWMFVSSITAYLFLSDFGVKSAVIRYVARYDGLGDSDGINRIVNSSLALLSCVGAIIVVGILAAAYFWNTPLRVPAEMAEETRWFLVLQGILVAILLPASVPNAVLAGLSRFPARNAISTASLILRHAMLVGAVLLGGNLVAVGLVLILNCTFDYCMTYWMARRYLPQLRLSTRFIDRETSRILFSYGGNMFVGDLAFMLIGQSAPLIIGAFLSSECVTYFSVGGSLKDYSLSILATVILVLTPAVSKWQAMGNEASIRVAFVHATKYALYFTAPLEIGLLLFGHPFLSLWMGREYADAGYATLAILSVPLLLCAVGLVASRVLQGLGNVRALAIISVIQALITVVLGIAFVGPLGIDGVAAGVSLAMVLCAPATAYLACRRVRVSFPYLLGRASAGPILASSAATAIWCLANQWIPIDNWFAFFGVGILGVIPFSIVLLILEPDVRRTSGIAARKCAGLLLAARRAPAIWLGYGKD